MMKRPVVVAGLIIVAVGSACICCKAGGKPSSQESAGVYLEKLNSVPDLLQTDPEGNLPDGGKFYCAPAAISNSFVWFADNGFYNLMPPLPDRKKAQFEIARALGTRRYMNTSLKVGTAANGVLRGVSRYIEDRGYDYQLEYQGWSKHPRRFGTGVVIPRLSWIKEGLKGTSAVWLNAGWYEYDLLTGRYHRIGEHWLTLVGYGVDKDGNKDPDVLIVHDPAPRAGTEPAHTYVKVELIRTGQLVGKAQGLPREAKGYYILGGDMQVKKAANFGILDGAVVLKLQKKEKSTQINKR